MEVLQKLESKERDGLGATGKDIVDYVVVAGFALVCGHARGVGDGVFDDGGVVGRELEVLGSKLVNHRVELDYSGIDAVSHKGGWRGADTEATGDRSANVYTYIYRGTI